MSVEFAPVRSLKEFRIELVEAPYRRFGYGAAVDCSRQIAIRALTIDSHHALYRATVADNAARSLGASGEVLSVVGLERTGDTEGAKRLFLDVALELIRHVLFHQ